MRGSDMADSEIEHIVWLLFRKAVQDHVERAEVRMDENEAKYRERAEKAGLVAVVNFIARAYRAEASF